MKEQEYVEVSDENGVYTGQKVLKSEAHRLGLWHTCVHVWLYNSNGGVLFQKRSSTKDTSPNLWDASVSGHISYGETPIQAALRELYEEIGVRSKESDIVLFFTGKKQKHNIEKNIIDNELYYVFGLETSLGEESFKLQEEEVVGVRYININEISSLLKKEKNTFVGGEQYYDKVISAISNKLS
ncbi:NUDIX hydrolase [Ichthyobacterium seriolicida]|uniref:NUDIX hydrolase n=1 Tax=Ichthyobacterium seriolicida TaxID=242600 RepID=A0A1J1DZR4_9FLAO|nr:NUDIX domain-containing protein [Ichthyobacterium seriolicida]BAV95393.1 NUDIX hydrolase [Ichthyobacterium seriolicida]